MLLTVRHYDMPLFMPVPYQSVAFNNRKVWLSSYPLAAVGPLARSPSGRSFGTKAKANMLRKGAQIVLQAERTGTSCRNVMWQQW